MEPFVNGSRASANRSASNSDSSSDAGSGEFEMLRLVQRLFLSSTGNVPKQVVFTGVGSDNGSAAVCVSAGQILAASSSRSVCLVEADWRSPGLAGLLGRDTHEPLPRSGSVRDRCTEIKENLWLAEAGLLEDDGGALASATQL